MDRKILVITADFVESTGTISFRFMSDCRYPEMHDMPRAWGHIWSDGDKHHSINIFKGGEGLQMGGGWTDGDTEEWEKKVLADMPSCTLLMTTATFKWWEGLCATHGVEFEHHHFVGGLKTS